MKKIILDAVAFEFNGDNCTILEILEKHGVPINYQCREGLCGVCRCKISSGKFYYKQEPLAMAKENEVFICIARALSDVTLNTL